MSPPTVNVLLATYNGARYLPELLGSLARQTVRPSTLVVRDDGSSDDTLAIIGEWSRQERIPVTRVDATERLGPARSFLTGLAAAPPADAHFLADQDDVWLPEKIERGLRALQACAPGVPALYASRLLIVDAALRPLRESPRPRRLEFASAACESILTGCTMAVSEPLRLLVAEAVPRDVVMHDWWLYLLATGTGVVRFDDVPTILYRQHESNTLGAELDGWRALVRRARRYLTKPPHVRSRQLGELLHVYDRKLDPGAFALASDLLRARRDVLARLRVALTSPIERQRWYDRIATRVTILANRF